MFKKENGKWRNAYELIRKGINGQEIKDHENGAMFTFNVFNDLQEQIDELKKQNDTKKTKWAKPYWEIENKNKKAFPPVIYGLSDNDKEHIDLNVDMHETTARVVPPATSPWIPIEEFDWDKHKGDILFLKNCAFPMAGRPCNEMKMIFCCDEGGNTVKELDYFTHFAIINEVE